MTNPDPAIRDVWHLNTRHLGRTTLVYHDVDSTNSRAAALAGELGSAGVAVLADRQSAGRGQHGRSWQAPPRCGVLLSVLLHAPGELSRPAILTAWAAVSVCEVVRHFTGVQPRIKWPNDVLLRGKKVCGILIEQGAHGASTATVAGIGLNVRQSADDLLLAELPLATSLACFASPCPDTDEVARRLIEQLDEEYDRLLNGELTTLEACWGWHLGLLGKEVVAECVDGLHEGRLTEMGFDGIVLSRRDRAPRFLVPEMILHFHTP
jgi:BirA family biotin operon repressor/biotin-[acetyl-CoA-carboxylase] ligase